MQIPNKNELATPDIIFSFINNLIPSAKMLEVILKIYKIWSFRFLNRQLILFVQLNVKKATAKSIGIK